MLQSDYCNSGSPQARAKAPLKFAILGDIHANLEALLAVLKDAEEQQCTHYACVGDVVGYNANPIECLEIVRERAMPCVKGNHDEYVSSGNVPENLSPRAAAAVLWTQHQLPPAEKQWLSGLKYTRLVASFSLVHATLDSPAQWGYVFESLAAAASFSYQTTQVCFFGHTHLPMVFVQDSRVRRVAHTTFRVEVGRKYLVNVGSVGEPRDGDPRAAYVTYEPALGTIELRRVPYDSEKAATKVRAAGLPDRTVRLRSADF